MCRRFSHLTSAIQAIEKYPHFLVINGMVNQFPIIASLVFDLGSCSALLASYSVFVSKRTAGGDRLVAPSTN